MDRETLQALMEAWRARPRADLLGIIIEKAQTPETQVEAAAFLASIDADAWRGEPQNAIRRKACLFAVEAEAHDLSVSLARLGDAPDDKLLLARALHASGRGGAEALAAYREAVAANPVLEDKDLEKSLGPRPEIMAANVISLSSHAARREQRSEGGDHGEASLYQLGLAVDEKTPVTFADVGGLAEVKSQIRRRIILPFTKPSLFERFKRKAGGGVLLYGPPGCGKTLLARSVAGECGARFINVAIAGVLDKYVGESEKRMAAIFDEARMSRPAVIFFDELEALAARRRYGSHDASASLVSAFLSELDGFSSANDGVLVLAATNVPWAIDSAFRRPGRFDRTQFVPPPDKAAREEILGLLLKDLPGAGAADIAKIVKRTSGFSGADLRHLVETAVDAAIDESLSRGEETSLSQAMFEEALKEVKPTTLEWLTTARNYAKYANAGGQYDDVLAFIDAFGK